MDLEELKEKFKAYNAKDIIITQHARIQAETRDITVEEVKQNILNPEKLVYAKEQIAEKKNEQKFDCYFGIEPNLYHRYIIVINGKLIIVTIIKINRSWQRLLEGKK